MSKDKEIRIIELAIWIAIQNCTKYKFLLVSTFTTLHLYNNLSIKNCEYLSY